MSGVFVLQLGHCQCCGALRTVPNSSQIKCLCLCLCLAPCRLVLMLLDNLVVWAASGKWITGVESVSRETITQSGDSVPAGVADGWADLPSLSLVFNSFLPTHYVNATFPPSTFTMTSSFLKSLQYIFSQIILFVYTETQLDLLQP